MLRKETALEETDMKGFGTINIIKKISTSLNTPRILMDLNRLPVYIYTSNPDLAPFTQLDLT